MTWSVEFSEEAQKDMKKLDHSARTDEQVYKEAAKRREKYDM